MIEPRERELCHALGWRRWLFMRVLLLCFFRKAISRSGLQHLGPPQPSLPPASNGPNKDLRTCVDWTVRRAHTLLLMTLLCCLFFYIKSTKRQLSRSALSLFCLAESPDDIWISMCRQICKQTGFNSRMFMWKWKAAIFLFGFSFFFFFDHH